MAKVKNKDKSNNIKIFIIAIFVAAVIAVLAVLGVGYYHDANNTETMSPGNVALVVGDTLLFQTILSILPTNTELTQQKIIHHKQQPMTTARS